MTEQRDIVSTEFPRILVMDAAGVPYLPPNDLNAPTGFLEAPRGILR